MASFKTWPSVGGQRRSVQPHLLFLFFGKSVIINVWPGEYTWPVSKHGHLLMVSQTLSGMRSVQRHLLFYFFGKGVLISVWPGFKTWPSVGGQPDAQWYEVNTAPPYLFILKKVCSSVFGQVKE